MIEALIFSSLSLGLAAEGDCCAGHTLKHVQVLGSEHVIAESASDSIGKTCGVTRACTIPASFVRLSLIVSAT